jgi:hypothetical protein
MTYQEAMAEVTKMAQEKDRVCYLYGHGPVNNLRLEASFQYWHDWLFKAYPGGRKVLSVEGNELLQKTKAAEHRVQRTRGFSRPK